MKKIIPFFGLIMLCSLFTTGCKDDTYEPWVNPPIDPDKINWEECLSVRVYGNRVKPVDEITRAGVNLEIAIVGEEPIQRIANWGRTLRIVNYGKEKIIFSDLWLLLPTPKYYETIWTSTTYWNDGLGFEDKTPNTKYVSADLPAQVGTYEFRIELIRDTELQTSPHYCSPRYKLTMAQDENQQWSLTFGTAE